MPLTGVTSTVEEKLVSARAEEIYSPPMHKLNLTRLGGRTFGMILIVASLSGQLFSQWPHSDPDVLNPVECHTCDLITARPNLALSPLKGGSAGNLLPLLNILLWAPSADYSNGWRSQLKASLPRPPVPADNLLSLGMSARSGLNEINRWSQQQSGAPDGQKKKKKHSPPATSRSPGHIFWVIPAYKVIYGKRFKPLTPKEKFHEWAQGEYDPLSFAAAAFEAATLEHSPKDGFCGYGEGWGSYGECVGSLELDSTDSSFIGDFALPVLLHQDPRYFRLGQGSFGKRLFYAISRVFVTYNDSGRTVFYTSALSGTVIAAALSNLYYPPQDVGAGLTATRIAIDLGNTALYNFGAEFWPDIHRKLHRIF